MSNNIELVGKIGSMALIDVKHRDLDYNRFARIGRTLHPGIVWVSSGATEIGRLDYMRRSGQELTGDMDEIKTDYAAQGQAILMETYRNFIDNRYSVRQLLVEHYHFNDSAKREHIRQMLLRCRDQGAIPIINYNDAVSYEENRKMEISKLRNQGAKTVELVDNDETAAQIACLVNAKRLLILTNTDGIYRDKNDPSSLITEIYGSDADDVTAKIDEAKTRCVGASRASAGGAAAKLEYVKPCVRQGSEVIIANAAYDIDEILCGKAPATRIGIR